jgi:hypothetical protein
MNRYDHNQTPVRHPSTRIVCTAFRWVGTTILRITFAFHDQAVLQAAPAAIWFGEQ